MTRLTLSLFLIFSASVLCQDFSSIDKHASRHTRAIGSSIDQLGDHLLKVCNTDIEKARAIYVWLTSNISYDIAALRSNQITNCDANHVFHKRKTVCEGFSNLFYELGKYMDLDIVKVHGYSKGLDHRKGQKFNDTDHAWNAIKIDSTWRLFDATWGEGYVDLQQNKSVSIKEFSDFWFDVDPYDAVFSHYPEDTNYLLIEPHLSLKEFEMLPYVNPVYFDYGFDGDTLFQLFKNNESFTFPKVYNVDANIDVLEAPALRFLKNKEDYTFIISASDVYTFSLKDAAGQWHTFVKDGDVYSLSIKIVGLGPVHLLMKQKKKDKSFSTILEYKSIR